MNCKTCSAETTGKYARFCDPCRARRRAKPKKYVCNERIDSAIREIYLSSPDAKSRPGIAALAARLKWPVWALRVRARELGLARAKDAPWSEPELAVLERYAWMTPPNIRPKLKAAGFVRTITAIHLKLRRMRFKQGLPYYTANGLALAFGVDSHVVLRWITGGQLYAKRKGEASRAQIADVWMVHERSQEKDAGA